MAEGDFDASPTLEAFLAAEIRNADVGGDWPVTLGTARDSLNQMDDETLADLNPGIAGLGVDRAALLGEINGLIGRLGPDFDVDGHVDPAAGR